MRCLAGGIGNYDIGFVVISVEQATAWIDNTWYFNVSNVLDSTYEVPDCSENFKTDDNVYSDFIQVDEQTFPVEFQLGNEATLELTLIRFAGVFSNQKRIIALNLISSFYMRLYFVVRPRLLGSLISGTGD